MRLTTLFRSSRKPVLIISASLLLMVPGIRAACEPSFPGEATAKDNEPPAGPGTPVILVHGFGASCFLNWMYLGLRLHLDGYDIYCHDFTDLFQSNVDNAYELAAFVEEVLAETGSDRVDIVSGSMGGVSLRYFIKYLWGEAVVEDVMTIASPNHGTWYVLPFSLFLIPAAEALPGSDFLDDLNAGDETPGDDILWTTIRPAVDQVIIPGDSAMLEGARNVRIWSCLGHRALFLNPVTYDRLVDALERGGWNSP